MAELEAGLRYRLRRAVRQIAAQHGHLAQALGALAEAVRLGDQARSLGHFDRLHDAVEAHFALEDRVIFPALHGLHPGRGDELSALSEDHERFLAELWRVRERVEAEDFPPGAKALEMLRVALRTHESREERLVGELVDE